MTTDNTQVELDDQPMNSQSEELTKALVELEVTLAELMVTTGQLKRMRTSNNWIYASKQLRNGMYAALQDKSAASLDLVKIVHRLLKKEKRAGFPEELADAWCLDNDLVRAQAYRSGTPHEAE